MWMMYASEKNSENVAVVSTIFASKHVWECDFGK